MMEKSGTGVLYIVPTPVGNLDDMTLRAINVLKEADLILAEDTRTSSVLLSHFGIKGRLQSHHKFNEHQTAEMIKDLIVSGKTVALVSDAGTPGISDPGFLLARTCAAEGHQAELAHIVALFHRHQPNRTDHIGIYDGNDAVCGLLQG